MLSLNYKMVKIQQPFCQSWQLKADAWLSSWQPLLKVTVGPWGNSNALPLQAICCVVVTWGFFFNLHFKDKYNIAKEAII